jgi:tRNA pseudouridine55 synthase
MSIVLIDKPEGVSSFDCIRILQKRARGEGKGKIKMGHAGTLDPTASGLLIIATGGDTKRLTDFLKLPKEYIADVLLGIATDSGDREGKEITRVAPKECVVSQENIREVIVGMVGTMTLPVSKYSAIKRGGEALYKKARRGEEVEAPLREMLVHEAQLLDFSERDDGYKVVRVRFDVESGVYIRSLGEELGKRLGCPASLMSLRRTQIGDMSVEDAESPETIDISEM